MSKGKPVSRVARSWKVRPNTVIDWRRRFAAEGIAGLRDRRRSGKPPRYTGGFRKQVSPCWKNPRRRGERYGMGRHWRSIGKHRCHAVWRVCGEKAYVWHASAVGASARTRSSGQGRRCGGFVLESPQNALVLSVDESRVFRGWSERRDSWKRKWKIVRGFKGAYKRRRLKSVCRPGSPHSRRHTQTTGKKQRIEFLEFIDRVVADLRWEKKSTRSWTITASTRKTMPGSRLIQRVLSLHANLGQLVNQVEVWLASAAKHYGERLSGHRAIAQSD